MTLRASLGVAALALVAAAAPRAEAQYFGRNKVQYETFDFKVLQTEHFDVYYYPEERDAAVLAGRMAERWYARFARILGHEMSGRQPLIMYANHPHFEQTNALAGDLSEGTGGVTEVFKRRIVLPFAAGLAETDHVIGHEIVHAFQYDITGEGRSVATGGIPGALRLPLWFIEGMAEYLSVGPEDPQTAMWMRDAVQTKLPKIQELGDAYRWFPYRWGQALWAYLGGRYGDEVVGRLLKTAGRSADPEMAMSRLLGSNLDELSAAWHNRLRETYTPLVDSTSPPSAYGEEILEGRGVRNLAPVISPDGSRLAFISTRDLFSIDIYVADVATGKVLHKITRTAVDPHFESLQFISSAGTWSPDGGTFAVAGISEGEPVLSLIDLESGKRTRDIKLPQLGEIYSPSWSPDGRRIVFSALQGGLSDLFVYDLERDELKRLTNDPFADLQPAWSPDGTRIAFASDRFTTDLARLEYGRHQIVLLDPATGAMETVPGFPTGKHINPQWSPDGKSLYFLSDRNGITNVYRVELASGELRQVTNLYGGVAGITPTSPALSVAAKTGKIAISVYRRDHEHIELLADSVAAGEPVRPLFAGIDPARLPPAEPIAEQVSSALADAVTGLPDTAEFATKQYSAGLGLDYLSRPSVLFASDQYGTYIGAGAQVYWSDMLGNRSLVTGLQVNGGIKDVAAVLGYSNLRRRLNWGVIGQQVPLVYSLYGSGVLVGDSTTQTRFVEQIVKYRQTNRDLSGLVSYPLSRSQRFEFSLGARNVTFEREVRTFFYDAVGRQIDNTKQSESLGNPITVGTASAAWVYDKSLFGATSPVLGQRFRLEASPVVGSVDYLGVLVDYRRYIIPVRPFTLAGRLVHYGRYGGNAEDTRLQPLFIGYPGLVRGYTDGSFTRDDCQASADESCPLFNRLIGTKVAIANLELRFPLLGALGVGSGYYGFLPIELAVFADGGLAWSNDLASTPSTNEEAWFLGGDRKPVTSAGIGARMNLFGFAIVEVDLSRAFQRHRWVWQFGFVPGF